MQDYVLAEVYLNNYIASTLGGIRAVVTSTLGYSPKLFKFTNYLLYIYISMNDERFNSCGLFF